MEQYESDRWILNDALEFWRACPTKRCRRARSCVGDSARCHEIFWPVVPEELKLWWREIFAAKRAGRSVTQARRKADAAMAEWKRVEAARAYADRALAGELPAQPAAARDESPRERTR